jgi:oxygen-independent coproporphyrinogen-3 oxidase
MSTTNNYNKVKNYLNILYKEIDAFAQFVIDNNIPLSIKEIHLGGGSPTFIEEPEFDILCDKLSMLTNLHDLDEFAIEVDPRRVKSDRLKYYREKGINRISLGIQDFDIDVQKAINRIQPPELIDNLFTPEIKSLFTNGINFDIICGLPNQTPETIRRTAEECVRLSPDRICLNFLHYAPRFAPHQKLMMDGKGARPDRLPDFSERKILFEAALKVLQAGGYIRTGYDHFAKSTDKVAAAMDEKKMHWNSLGVTPGEYTNIIGLGISSESTIFNHYFQNYYGMEDYISAVEEGKFPVYRGYSLTQDDLIRKDVIQKLRNYFEVDIKEIELQNNISFTQYFHNELHDLKTLEKDGILSFTDDTICLSEFGRRFTNIVCRVFDTHYSGDLLKKDLGQRDL